MVNPNNDSNLIKALKIETKSKEKIAGKKNFRKFVTNRYVIGFVVTCIVIVIGYFVLQQIIHECSHSLGHSSDE